MRPLILCSLLLLTLNITAAAKSWRGIVPLTSTRSDVEKILGKPIRENSVYKAGAGEAKILYSRSRCEQNLPSGWGNWNVPADTVINISFEVDIPVKNLKIRNLEKYKWYTDDSRATYYRLPVEGIEYIVRDGRVLTIIYGPTEKDKGLRCRKDVPEIKY